MYKWIKNRWSDPVWSNDIANLIWAVISLIAILSYTLLKKIKLDISFQDAWIKTLEFFSSKHMISNLWILIVFILIVFILINKEVIKRYIYRIINRYYIQEEYIFRKQISDDDYYPIPILTPRTKHKLIIKPIDSPYWRFGFTLSQNGSIDRSSRQKKMPLFHLTKNLNNNQLLATEYDDSFKLVTNNLLLIDNYVDQSVKVILNYDMKTTSTVIRVIDINNRELISRSYLGYQYVILSTWGDGNNYKISMKRNSYF